MMRWLLICVLLGCSARTDNVAHTQGTWSAFRKIEVSNREFNFSGCVVSLPSQVQLTAGKLDSSERIPVAIQIVGDCKLEDVFLSGDEALNLQVDDRSTHIGVVFHGSKPRAFAFLQAVTSAGVVGIPVVAWVEGASARPSFIKEEDLEPVHDAVGSYVAECYGKSANGPLSVRVVVGSDGKVLAAGVLKSSAAETDAVRCVSKRLIGLDLPKPVPSGDLFITFDYTFGQP